MKKVFVALAGLGVVSVVLWRVRPTLAAHAERKCEDMMERMGGGCVPRPTTACAESTCSGDSPGD